MTGFVAPMQEGGGITIDWSSFSINVDESYDFNFSGIININNKLNVYNIGGTSDTQSANDTIFFGDSSNNNFFIDMLSSNPQLILGYNSPKSSGNQSIFQVYNNSSDRNLVFSVSNTGKTVNIDTLTTNNQISGEYISIDNTYIIENNGNLSLNINNSYNWGGTHNFLNGMNAISDVFVNASNTATSTSNYNSYSLEFQNSIWSSSGDYTLETGTIGGNNIENLIVTLYINGTQVAQIQNTETASTSYTFSSGTQTIEIKITGGGGSSSTKSIKTNLNSYTGTLKLTVTNTNNTTIYGYGSITYSQSSGAIPNTGQIFLDTNNILQISQPIQVNGNIYSHLNYFINSYMSIFTDLSGGSFHGVHDTDNNNSVALAVSSSDISTNSEYIASCGSFNSTSDSKLKVSPSDFTKNILSDISNIKISTWNKQYKVNYDDKNIPAITNETYNVGNRIGILADTLPADFQEVDSYGIHYLNSNYVYGMLTKAVQELYANQQKIANKIGITL